MEEEEFLVWSVQFICLSLFPNWPFATDKELILTLVFS